MKGFDIMVMSKVYHKWAYLPKRWSYPGEGGLLPTVLPCLVCRYIFCPPDLVHVDWAVTRGCYDNTWLPASTPLFTIAVISTSFFAAVFRERGMRYFIL